MYLPTINTLGVYEFKAPFNVDPYKNRVLKVIAIRSLEELQKDGVDPLNNIYLKIKLTEVDYNNDYKESIPVIVFKTRGEKLLYVPANRITGMPKIDGIPYVRRGVLLNLGSLPTTINLSNLEQALKDTCMEFIGLEPTTKITTMSEISLVDKTEHTQFMSRLNNTPYAQRNKPFKLRYNELLENYDELLTKYNELSKFLAKTWANNVVNSNRPTQADLELYTKKCVIEVVAPIGANKKAGLNSIVFYKRNAYNLEPKPVYMKGMIQQVSSTTEYTAMLDKTPCTFALTKGGITNQNLPDIFSDLCHVEFDKDITTNESRGKIELVFSEPVNIMDMKLRPAIDTNINCSRVRVVLYNKNDIMIYSVSFQLGTHYSVSTAQGLTQYLKINDMQLSTNIPQATPPELTP